MTRLPGSGRDRTSTRTRAGGRSAAAPLLAALGLSLFGFLAVGLAGARPVTAANPSMSPFVPGRHVYDNGGILSAHSAATAESLAAHIEAEGGGRIVLYTTPQSGDMPDSANLAQDWQIDGLLINAQGGDGELTVGATLTGKLPAMGAKLLNSFSSPGPQTTGSWMLSTLARVDAFLSDTHVFDGAGALDAAGKQKAEAAAQDLSGKIGATVYIDIALGGTDPSSAAFFNGADITSDLGTNVVIALAVSDTQIGGYIGFNGDVSGNYATNAPWKSDVLDNEAAPNGDVGAALQAAIAAVQQPPLISSDAIPVIVFVVVIVIFSITAPFLWGPWLIRKMTGTSGPIKGGVPGDAIIESIADTGVTVTMAGTGPEAPEYRFGLQVTPGGGGAPYQVSVKAFVPRLYVPMTLPGARIGVLIDPTNPMKVSLDFSRINSAPLAGSGMGGGGSAPGGMGINFDAGGQPESGQVAALVGAVNSGALPSIKGSADHILAIGTHGTAVITTAQPLGKTVRDINPAADPSRLNDPVWLFTLEVNLAGQAPFPAVFGHRVPLAKLAMVAPGVKLAVAVDPSNPGQEVAIDWDKSPISSII